MTSLLPQQWHPDDWEEFTYGMLQDRHGPLNVHRVPARHKGDHGLDYYCLTDLVVYQCYAVEEPCDVAARSRKQVSKATADLKKFSKNSAMLRTLFNGSRIRRWVLLVPLHDSIAVNQHLARKSADIRRLSLPYVAPDFEAAVHDLTAFPARSVAHRALMQQQITLTGRTPTTADVATWSASQNSLVHNLIGKLKKRVGTTAAAEADDVIGWFLARENTLEELQRQAPQLYESLHEVIARRTRRLSLTGPATAGSAQQVLEQAINDLSASICSAVPNLAPASVETMTLGTIAEWLLRCPLDFAPFDNAAT